jgi:hypothetical protein
MVSFGLSLSNYICDAALGQSLFGSMQQDYYETDL